MNHSGAYSPSTWVTASNLLGSRSMPVLRGNPRFNIGHQLLKILIYFKRLSVFQRSVNVVVRGGWGSSFQPLLSMDSTTRCSIWGRVLSWSKATFSCSSLLSLMASWSQSSWARYTSLLMFICLFPFLTGITFIPPIAVTVKYHLPVNDSASVPPNAPHYLLAMERFSVSGKVKRTPSFI